MADVGNGKNDFKYTFDDVAEAEAQETPASSEEAPEDVPEDVNDELPPTKVLFVYTDKKAREMIAFLLENRFICEIFEAPTVEEASKIVEQETCLDLVLCDIVGATPKGLLELIKSAAKP